MVLPLLAALGGCTTGQDPGPEARPVQAPAPAPVAGPLASFARMLPGEWRVTYANGTTQVDTWHRGPGEHSLRAVTDGTDAAGDPWRELLVVYWHPGRKQARLLGLNPYMRSVMEGTIELAGETAVAAIDLHQIGARRELGLRWNFTGPDHYRETLLEATGAAGLVPLVEWDYVRSSERTPPRPLLAGAAEPSQRLAVLEPLLGHTWEARGEWATGGAVDLQTTFEYIPYADAVYARTTSPTGAGEPTHLLDAYFYHHTGTDALRFLALSSEGGVYEGDVTALAGGAVQLGSTGHEGDRTVEHVVQFEPAPDGRLHHRVWSLGPAGRTLVLAVQHEQRGA